LLFHWQKNLPNATVSAIDVSEKALATAKKNAQNNSVNVFYQSKHSQAEDLKQQFDIIVSIHLTFGI
jgi:release factor glutamine methyltransferase